MGSIDKSLLSQRFKLLGLLSISCLRPLHFLYREPSFELILFRIFGFGSHQGELTTENTVSTEND